MTDQNQSTRCQLATEPFYQCCCNCTSRLTDYKHCSIHGRVSGKCVCSEVKGYVCAGFAFDEGEGRVHSEWPEHSCGCELYSARVPRAVAMGNVEYASWGVSA